MKYKINDIVYQKNSDEPMLVTGYLQQSDCVRYYLMRQDGTEDPYFENNITDVKPYDFSVGMEDLE
jgi:hypothetical protein